MRSSFFGLMNSLIRPFLADGEDFQRNAPCRSKVCPQGSGRWTLLDDGWIFDFLFFFVAGRRFVERAIIANLESVDTLVERFFWIRLNSEFEDVSEFF